MAEFNWEWNDFNGGFCVSHSDVNQPKNTWKGYNVTVADDDATLVPAYTPTQLTLTGTDVSGGVISHGSTNTKWSDPTYMNGYVVVTALQGSTASVYFINTETGAVVKRTLTGVTAKSVGTAPICISWTGSTNIWAYVVVGGYDIYMVTTENSTVTTFTSAASPGDLAGLTLWNARLIAWSDVFDKIIFSDPFQFNPYATEYSTAWPSLNYLAAGYADDGVSQVIPRNMDLVVVKPSGWFSITGVLGVSAAVRQMNDTIGIFPSDPIDQHNNIIYFTTNTGYTDYAINLYQIVGGRIDVAAFQRFGLGDSNARVTKTNMGYLALTALTDDPSGTTYCTAFIMNMLEKWEVLKINRVIPAVSGVKPKFAFARAQVSRYRETLSSDRYLYMIESTTSGSDNKLAVIKVKPNTVEPGKNSDNTPAEGVVKLSNILTRRAFTIKELYVEAEMIQLPNIGNMTAYTGSASISCYVNNKSVSDITFTDSKPSPYPNSDPYTYPYSSFTSETDAVSSQIRVIRFRVDNASWMYGAEVEFHFAGLKIRRVWLHGDSR